MKHLAIFVVMAGALFSATAAKRKPTFSEDIAPIVFNNCVSCHRPGEAAPFSLISYEDASRRGALIAKVTGSRYMPPWHAEPGFGDGPSVDAAYRQTPAARLAQARGHEQAQPEPALRPRPGHVLLEERAEVSVAGRPAGRVADLQDGGALHPVRPRLDRTPSVPNGVRQQFERHPV